MRGWLRIGIGVLLSLSMVLSSCGGGGSGSSAPSKQDPPLVNDPAIVKLRTFSVGDIWSYSLIEGAYVDADGTVYPITDGKAWLQWGVDRSEPEEGLECWLLRFSIAAYVTTGGEKRPVNVTTDTWMRQLADRGVSFCGYWPDLLVVDPAGGVPFVQGELSPGWKWNRTISVSNHHGLSWNELWDIELKGQEQLDTPYGKFQAYRLEMTVTSFAGRTQTTWWVVPDVGVVGIDRVEEVISGETVFVSFRLEDYQIK